MMTYNSIYVEKLEKELINAEALISNIRQLYIDSYGFDPITDYCVEPGIHQLEEAKKTLQKEGILKI